MRRGQLGYNRYTASPQHLGKNDKDCFSLGIELKMHSLCFTGMCREGRGSRPLPYPFKCQHIPGPDSYQGLWVGEKRKSFENHRVNLS